jgi:hypothetical protein
MIPFRDPTLDELLGDPIIQAIMNADRVDLPTLAAMLRTLAREIGARSGGTATALAAAPGARFGRSAVGLPTLPAGVLRDPASGCVSGSSIRSRICGAP